MRITQLHRQSFIRAVMDDVPAVDYQEQAKDVVQKYLVSKMPPKLRAVYDDPLLRGHLQARWVRVCNMISDHFYGAPDDHEIPAAIKSKVSAIMQKAERQEKKLNELRQSLRSAVYGISTRKRLLEVLPEFEKYAPIDGVLPTPNLPAVIVNITPMFKKAGWPKPESQTAAT